MGEDHHALEYQPVSAVFLKTVMAAFTFLTALSIRDTTSQIVESITPSSSRKKLLLTLFLTMFFMLITVALAYSYQDYVD